MKRNSEWPHSRIHEILLADGFDLTRGKKRRVDQGDEAQLPQNDLVLAVCSWAPNRSGRRCCDTWMKWIQWLEGEKVWDLALTHRHFLRQQYHFWKSP